MAVQLDSIAFPYIENDEIWNYKFRGPSKRFLQCKNARKLLYGLDGLKNAKKAIIVEGEMDKLAADEVSQYKSTN